MAPQFTLYSHRGPGPNPLKAAILLEKLGLTYDVIALDFSNDSEKGVKGSKFLKLNPNGRVPALVDHQNKDFTVWESGAILYYLVEKYDKDGKFFGTNAEDRAVVMQWLTHQLSGLGPAQGQVSRESDRSPLLMSCPMSGELRTSLLASHVRRATLKVGLHSL